MNTGPLCFVWRSFMDRQNGKYTFPLHLITCAKVTWTETNTVECLLERVVPSFLQNICVIMPWETHNVCLKGINIYHFGNVK
ncbi:unnamed protein product [Coffea canephora]|uniref:Uncharacterized protein n=1 Tax=Coffea canephora TaxID=49390 RepID=A0A068UB01_COFCA|nr:unnamed protein product [Coffea canephora]